MKVIKLFLLVIFCSLIFVTVFLLLSGLVQFNWQESTGGVCNPHAYQGLKIAGKVIYAKQIACPFI